MRIAVLHHHEDLSNDFAAYLSALLDDTADEYGYAVKDYEQLLRFREPLSAVDSLLHIVIPASKRFPLKYWYNAKLPRIIKKYGIEKVLCTYGIPVGSNVRQLLVFPDKDLFDHTHHKLVWQQFFAKRLPKVTGKAATIISYSTAAEETLKTVTGIGEEKIFLMPYTVNELFKPMEWHDKLYIKSRFAENKEYFVAVLPDNDEKMFTGLLKAFSKFKKWQQSNMQLLLLPKEEGFSSAIGNKLDTYKFRNDVKLINDAEPKETADIIAASYAMLHFSQKDPDLWPVAAALQSAIPVIGFNNSSIREYCEAAGIFADNGDAFGEQLILLYKDESLRGRMSDTALEQAKKYNRKERAAAFWQLLSQA